MQNAGIKEETLRTVQVFVLFVFSPHMGDSEEKSQKKLQNIFSRL